ncbi:Serine/threonine-protein kinase PknB [Streptomyces sp. S4.7]|uniref:serine/threonine-protein kinase n=1 Tax=Streptomyces sp. S4.7 TaxID=2705439 RepID=UPI001398C11A|nr:serine/threonine-protein kinase [Streptomyces sp. S4.7]QHY97027.1 Serine/threonine-protein kinase PknB [Streptomyces sp. S4.7]
MTLLVSGDRVSDTLVIDRPLGEGAFAEVHRVRHEYLGWQAMKLFKRVASLEETRRMLDEARLLSTLGHPNIVRLFDANTVRTPEGLRGFFTMEYVAGGSLERLAAAHKSMVPRDLVAEVMTQIASGLAVAHDQDPPIVHRDVTLANVLIGYDGAGMRVRVSDFGLAKRADPFTHLASAQGTYAFMAPEVMRNQGYSCASDVWSVGVIAYLLLTNRFPFHQGGEEFSSFSFGRFNRSLLPPSSYNDEVDADLDRIVLATLELDPQNRPATAQFLADALRERAESMAGAAAGVPGSAAPGASRTTGEPPRPTTRRPVGPPTERARRLAEESLALARSPGELDRAADLMEEAVNLSPYLRDRYLSKLTLWRRGVMM